MFGNTTYGNLVYGDTGKSVHEIFDSATGTSVLQIEKDLIPLDSAQGIDNFLIDKDLIPSDSAAGIDNLNLDKTLIFADSGISEDALAILKRMALEKARAFTRLKPLWLVDIQLQNNGPTLRFSDRNIIIDTVVYENYLDDLNNLEEEIERSSSEGLNPRIRLKFKNSKFRGYNHLIEIGDIYPFEGAEITVKKVYLDENNIPSIEETCFKGVLDEPENIDLIHFECSVSSMPFAKDQKFKQEIIEKSKYPDADPNDLNKYENIIYGFCEQVRCHAIRAGAQDFLSEDITASQTSFQVSDASEFSSGTIIIQIEDEQMQGYFSGNTFNVTQRGYGGTTAVAHDKGMQVFEVLTEYVYLVASHPVKSIGDIYVDGVRQLSGFTKYTGQPGNEHPNYPGKAVITFSAKPVLKKQVNLDTNDTIDVNDGIGVGDNIDFSSPETSKTIIPNGGTAELRDGNTGSGVDVSNNPYVTFPSTSYGTIVRQHLWVYRSNTGSPITVSGGFWGTLAVASGWMRISKNGGNWNDGATFSGGPGYVYEVYKEVEYIPTLTKSGSAYKTGSATKVGTVTLVGNSSADVVVGKSVNCDVEGYQDDVSGTYTGTPNALIERPDHLFKHFITTLYGFSLSDIDTSSFNTAGSSYSSAITGGYKFAFVIDEKIQPSEFLAKLAFQCRSNIKYDKGKWYLNYLHDTAPSAVKTISKSDLAGKNAKFTFHKTPIVDIANDLTAKFKKNYGRLSYDESEWLGTSTASDTTSQSKYGTKPKEFEFWAIRSQTMADHVLSFLLQLLKQPLLKVEFIVFWEHFDLEIGDTFDISNDLYNGKKFYIEKIEYVDKFRMKITAIEWW